MSKQELIRGSVAITAEQNDFLRRIIHEDAAKNKSEAVQWCIDSCMRIEKLYGVDACYVAFNDIRLPENDPAQSPDDSLEEGLQLARDAGMSQADWDKQNPQPDFKWFPGESLPTDIAYEALKEKFPDGKEYDPNHYLPKNHTVILRATADWGIQWGWKHPLPWEVKDRQLAGMRKDADGMCAEIKALQEQNAALLASNKEWGEKYAETCRERDEYRKAILALEKNCRMAGEFRAANHIAKYISQFPELSKPTQL